MAFEVKEEGLAVRGEVAIEEIEDLVGALEGLREQLGDKPIRLELADCLHMHTAGVQALLEMNCEVMSWPVESDWSQWLRAGFEL